MTVGRTGDSTELGLRPLYIQVRERLLRRLVDGVWAPGDLLPSEMQIASELGVSQGTVRKALDVMAAENLVLRKQGRGTFVSRPDDERVMFQFFRVQSDDGERRFPESHYLSVGKHRATAEEQGMLALAPGASVIRLERVRSIAGRPAIVETVIVPAALFGELPKMDLPNNLYGLFAMHFGIAIMRATEKVKAVAATEEEARILGVAVGLPLLRISRVAYSLENVPVEWRLSSCCSEDLHYLAELK